MRRTPALLSALVWAAASAATAQPAPDPGPAGTDPEASYVEELVVRGRLPGPAWWRVSDDDTTVYVLGLPDVVPAGLAWDRTVLDRRLSGANVLVLPPVLQAGASPLAAPGLLISARRAMGDKARPDEALSGAQLARLKRLAISGGAPIEKYGSLRPWMAGVRVAAAHRKRAGLSQEELIRTVKRAAGKAKVRSAPATTVVIEAKTVLVEVNAMPPGAGHACFDAALDEVESGPAARRAAEAWAQGDTRVALGAPRSSELCLGALASIGADTRRLHARQADAIGKMLTTPGHAVAALSLRSLLAQGGTLELLRSRGYRVQTPE